MPSIIWGRDPQEAYKNPYEYKAQNQFAREAKKILDKLFAELMNYSLKFKRDDTSIKKAIWMLQTDALDNLRDCLKLLKQKNQRVAGRIFRDVMESLNMAAFFASNTEKSNKELEKWYKDEIISHSKYRDFIEKTKGKKEAENIKEYYRILSKFTHRTYRTLAYGYSLGKNNLLVYEGYAKNNLLVLPHTISMYYALLANFITVTSNEIINYGLIKDNIIKTIWEDSLEEKTIPRRFSQNS